MIEVNDNVDLVTMRRKQDMQRAQESYRKAVAEGRLAVRSRQGASTDGRAALVAADYGGVDGQVATSATIPGDSVPADPEVAWRHTRLAITAGLVVLLLVIWILQKKAGR